MSVATLYPYMTVFMVGGNRYFVARRPNRTYEISVNGKPRKVIGHSTWRGGDVELTLSERLEGGTTVKVNVFIPCPLYEDSLPPSVNGVAGTMISWRDDGWKGSPSD